MKVLLVAPIKENFMGWATFPPVGLGYIATALRKDSHEVEILDCIKEKFTQNDFRNYVETKKPDAVGFTVFSLALEEVKESLATIKRISPDTLTMVGGPHPSALPEKVLCHLKDADYAFKGEAEMGVPALLQHHRHKKKDLSGVPGLIWRTDNGKIKVNDQILISNLDSLGFPAWDLIRPREYYTPGSIITRNTAALFTTRGCPYYCTFCSVHTITTRNIRKRSVDHVLEEMRLLHNEFNITNFVIGDDNFTFYKSFAKEFCQAVIREKQNYTFSAPAGIRLDTLDQTLLTLMKKAGFSTSIAVGIESGSERILQLIKKDLHKEQIREKINLLNETGFRPIGYFVLGFPGETKEEMLETINFAMELNLYKAAFTPFIPQPGTENTNHLMAIGELAPDFDFSQLRTDGVIYTPKGMTLEELDNMRKKAILRFYLRPKVLWHLFTDYSTFRFLLVRAIKVFATSGNIIRPKETTGMEH